MLDRLEIRELIESWALWRDAGDWERLARIWHPEGRMTTTWFQASGAEFVERSRLAWASGTRVLHMLGGCSIDLNGPRAIAQTKMQIIQRAVVHGVLVEVHCYGRFWDAFEKRDSRWGLLLRQPIYEMDRMFPVDPSETVRLAPHLLASFPEGYRHLAYLQTQLGFDVSRTLPGTRGPEVEALRAGGHRWLRGEIVDL